MLKMKKNKITLSRGNTAYINISVKEYKLQIGDVVKFSVKKDINTNEFVFTKEVEISEKCDSVTIKIEPDDTNSYEFGEYIYDVKITRKNGDINTIITPNVFIIDKVVS